MHNYGHDFYGKILKVCICGYIRPEQNFGSLEALIARINLDIEIAEKELTTSAEYIELKNSDYFTA